MKLIRLGAFILAAVILSTGLIFTANAESESSYYEEQVLKFEEMKRRAIPVELEFAGGYVVKASKFYGRRVIGVEPDGSFIPGPWELLDYRTNEPMMDATFYVPGTYVQFAYSCDIFWGTDWPYSGVFWNEINTPVEGIEIMLQGLVRNVSVPIYVNDELSFCNDDCDAHSEWWL